MNTTFLRTMASMTLLVAANIAFADHIVHRDLEDKAFTAVIQAREIRTEIRDHFDGSSRYSELMEEATKIYRKAIELEEALLCGRPAQVVCREIDQTLAAMKCFRQSLDGCDFAMVRPGHYRSASRGNGYSFRPVSQSPGYRHVMEVRRMLDELNSTVDCVHDSLDPVANARPLPVHPQPVPMVPGTGYHYRGESGRPVGPALPPPSAGRSRDSWELPVHLGGRSGVVLRVPLK